MLQQRLGHTYGFSYTFVHLNMTVKAGSLEMAVILLDC